MCILDISYSFYQHYWWALIALLGALLVFLLFVQGGQTFIYQLSKTDNERTLLVNALGRKWELTFTTLVTFGGAFFASFPLFYSTSFGGAYWVWMALLFCFVVQAVAYEYRRKPNNFLKTKTYDAFLLINGFGGTFLLGVVVGTFFTGANFSMNKENITNISGNVVISQWQSATHGLEALLNVQNVLLGLAVFFLARILGCLFFIYAVNSTDILKRAKKQLLINSIPFVITFLAFVFMLLMKDGFAVNSATTEVSLQQYKYLNNLLEMPIVGALFLLGVLLVLSGIAIPFLKKEKSFFGFWFSGMGTVLVVFSLFLIAGYNNTAYYPSLYNIQHSLTIQNSCSSYFTLSVMAVVSLFIPFILLYIRWAWKKLTQKKISIEEVSENENSY